MNETEKIKILILEEKEQNGKNLSNNLFAEFSGREISATQDTETVVDLISNSEIDLIIADVDKLELLRIEENFDLINWVKDYAPKKIPIVLIGDRENPPVKHLGEIFLQKPIDMDELEGLIEHLI